VSRHRADDAVAGSTTTTWEPGPADPESAPSDPDLSDHAPSAARRIRAASSLLLDDSRLLLPLATHLGGQPVFESAIHGSSMSPAIPRGARLRVQLLGQQACRPGDVVFFLADAGYMVHRVVYRARRGGAENYLLTRGDSRLAPDPPVRCDRVLGTVTAVQGAGGWRPPGPPAGGGGVSKGMIRAGALAAMIVVLRGSPSLARRLGASLARAEWIARAVAGRYRRRLQRTTPPRQ
jgi:hypothetical protein